MKMTEDEAAMFAEAYNMIRTVSVRGDDAKRIARAMYILESFSGAEVVEKDADTEGITRTGDALQRTAASLAAAGNDIDEAVQNLESVGTAESAGNS